MDSSAAQPVPARSFPWLITRTYTFLLAGQSVSVLGDFLFDTTLILWIAAGFARHQAWAPAAVSGVLLATAIPTIAVGLFAGVFVDRWNRRTIMLTCDAARATLITILIVGSGLLPGERFHLAPIIQLALIYVTVALSTACGQFFLPARSAIIQRIVPAADLPKASSYSQVAMPLATLIGPPIAAPLFFALGPGWALAADAASFLVSFVAVWLAGINGAGDVRTERRGYAAELREGLSFLSGNRILVVVTVTAVIAMLGGGAINALDVFFVRQNLHASLSLYGLLGAGFGAGLLLGAILAPLVIERVGLLRSFWGAALAAGCVVIVYARADSFVWGLVLGFVAALPIAVLSVAVQPIVLRVTPNQMMGRVQAVLNPAISLATILSIGLAGIIDSTLLHGFHAHLLGLTFGPVDTIFTAGGILFLAGALYASLALRGVQMPKTETSEPAGNPI
ncbi:MAG TPA: MFS transporter [Chloroflexota bacterium]|nr:MFS transporter [Chloroflexota bacterium]